MNVGSALKAVDVLPSDWKLASGNYDAIVHVTSVYGTPRWLDLVLLVSVILWESLAAVLFWWAVRRYWIAAPRRWHAVYLAFTTLVALFGMFIIMDELFHTYKLEGDHRSIAVLLLASLLALQLLPDRAPDH